MKAGGIFYGTMRRTIKLTARIYCLCRLHTYCSQRTRDLFVFSCSATEHSVHPLDIIHVDFVIGRQGNGDGSVCPVSFSDDGTNIY